MLPESADDVCRHRDWLLSLAPISEPSTLVDLGCGSGGDLLALAARYRHPDMRFCGVDASGKAIAAAAARAAADPRIDLRQHRLWESLPFEDSAFDITYSNNLIECLADRTGFAREVARILRPGGVAVMAHWDWDSQQFDGPDKALVRRLVHAFADWRQDWMDHADGWMGRRLWGTFNATGLYDGAVHARVLTNTTYAPPCFGHARARDFRSLVDRGMAAAEDYDRFIADQETLGRQGRYFYSITGYAYVGRRRASRQAPPAASPAELQGCQPG